MRKHIPISEKLAQTHGVMMFSLEIDSIGLDLVDIYCFDILHIASRIAILFPWAPEVNEPIT